ncbi:formate dehydrogenase subunit delta [Streptosporangium lutulentum]|uniref:Formate dehydrogenase subunit delta n=1 Tax=Streptosporangium lutulentum TaxID=1461250 RepID=A0ABT9QDI4_9ACTN|nr:formate dehydrogenase subunit delta [Streptosporangium lutulentum]MDP9844826.1 formate dehydrogenase subunit delta [Streptosporangium lutulentum]
MTSTHTPPHIRLANEIAAQFQRRDPADAARAIADHIQSFWDPRMRIRLIAAAQDSGSGLDPLAVAAAALLPPPVDRHAEPRPSPAGL